MGCRCSGAKLVLLQSTLVFAVGVSAGQAAHSRIARVAAARFDKLKFMRIATAAKWPREDRGGGRGGRGRREEGTNFVKSAARGRIRLCNQSDVRKATDRQPVRGLAACGPSVRLVTLPSPRTPFAPRREELRGKRSPPEDPFVIERQSASLSSSLPVTGKSVPTDVDSNELAGKSRAQRYTSIKTKRCALTGYAI